MQWRHPLSLSLTTPQTITPPSPPTTQINTNSNIPFRELLLQQQQQTAVAEAKKKAQAVTEQSILENATMAMYNRTENQQNSDIKRNLENFSTIATSLATAAAAAAAVAATTGTTTTANSLISSSATTERERNALVTHFHERDRLILQHQQQQLQQQHQQQHKKEQILRLEAEREKSLNNNDRLHDYVIGERSRFNSNRLKSNGKFY